MKFFKSSGLLKLCSPAVHTVLSPMCIMQISLPLSVSLMEESGMTV